MRIIGTMPIDPVLRPRETPAQPAPAAPPTPLGSNRDEPAAAPDPAADECDYCGSTALRWIKCKLICDNCHQINKSCADL